MAQIERMYGKGAIMRLGDSQDIQVDVIPTGSLAPGFGAGDRRRASGGALWRSTGRSPPARPPWPSTSWPRPSAGAARPPLWTPSTPWTHTYARALGVNIEDMLIAQPDTGEQALEITEALVRSGGIDVVVVDSVAALVPRPRSRGRWGTAMWASTPAS